MMKRSFFLWGLVFIFTVFVWVVSISFKGNGHFYPENSFQEVIKKKEENQSFYLYLGRKDCKECQRVTKKISIIAHGCLLCRHERRDTTRPFKTIFI